MTLRVIAPLILFCPTSQDHAVPLQKCCIKRQLPCFIYIAVCPFARQAVCWRLFKFEELVQVQNFTVLTNVKVLDPSRFSSVKWQWTPPPPPPHPAGLVDDSSQTLRPKQISWHNGVFHTGSARLGFQAEPEPSHFELGFYDTSLEYKWASTCYIRWDVIMSSCSQRQDLTASLIFYMAPPETGCTCRPCLSMFASLSSIPDYVSHYMSFLVISCVCVAVDLWSNTIAMEYPFPCGKE